MANVNDFACDDCGEIIGQSPTPVLVYIVAGVPPMAQARSPEELDLNRMAAPAFVRELMAQPVARREFCLKCFAQTFGLELVNPAAAVAPAAPAS